MEHMKHMKSQLLQSRISRPLAKHAIPTDNPRDVTKRTRRNAQQPPAEEVASANASTTPREAVWPAPEPKTFPVSIEDRECHRRVKATLRRKIQVSSRLTRIITVRWGTTCCRCLIIVYRKFHSLLRNNITLIFGLDSRRIRNEDKPQQQRLRPEL